MSLKPDKISKMVGKRVEHVSEKESNTGNPHTHTHTIFAQVRSLHHMARASFPSLGVDVTSNAHQQVLCVWLEGSRGGTRAEGEQ